jgi:hypothetical protein
MLCSARAVAGGSGIELFGVAMSATAASAARVGVRVVRDRFALLEGMALALADAMLMVTGACERFAPLNALPPDVATASCGPNKGRGEGRGFTDDATVCDSSVMSCDRRFGDANAVVTGSRCRGVRGARGLPLVALPGPAGPERVDS